MNAEFYHWTNRKKDRNVSDIKCDSINITAQAEQTFCSK